MTDTVADKSNASAWYRHLTQEMIVLMLTAALFVTFSVILDNFFTSGNVITLLRSVDVGSIVEIHQLINELADAGIAVVLISSYLPEILGLSDRILVARQGQIVEEMSATDSTEERIMYAAVH